MLFLLMPFNFHSSIIVDEYKLNTDATQVRVFLGHNS